MNDYKSSYYRGIEIRKDAFRWFVPAYAYADGGGFPRFPTLKAAKSFIDRQLACASATDSGWIGKVA